MPEIRGIQISVRVQISGAAGLSAGWLSDIDRLATIQAVSRASARSNKVAIGE
jgi:hypothetical protein